MNSLIRKILKTFFSIIITFFLFIIIISISLYIYIGKGLEFKINKSNSAVASLSEQYNIDFDTSSTIPWDTRVEICSGCHPFYTGEQKILKTGAVDKFYARKKKMEEMQKKKK